jgi:hypothetical protein
MHTDSYIKIMGTNVPNKKLTSSFILHERSLFSSLLDHGPARADCGVSGVTSLAA